jgi:hypothetical protein
VNVLDENIITAQRLLLRSWRIPIRQVGYDIGRRGIQDEEILPFLLQLPRPTFFTRDADFYDRWLCHARYCLVYLAIQKQDAALFVRRFLQHKAFDTQAKRLGKLSRFHIVVFLSGDSTQKKRPCLAGRNNAGKGVKVLKAGLSRCRRVARRFSAGGKFPPTPLRPAGNSG